MNAIARQDFSEFLDFIRTLSIDGVVQDATRVAEIRKAHAQFLALLTTVGELVSDAGSVRNEFVADYDEVGKSYLGEVVSDCSEFVMSVLLGLCRSAGGTLRSSIESYLKAFSAKEQPLILKRTSVPDVFDDAAGVAFFSSPIGKSVISDLKVIYGELNAYVHTVSDARMFGAIAILRCSALPDRRKTGTHLQKPISHPSTRQLSSDSLSWLTHASGLSAHAEVELRRAPALGCFIRWLVVNTQC